MRFNNPPESDPAKTRANSRFINNQFILRGVTFLGCWLNPRQTHGKTTTQQGFIRELYLWAEVFFEGPRHVETN